MNQGIPQAGQMNIPQGIPMGGGIVDFLASVPENRIWHVLRHEKDITAASTGQLDFFDIVTPAAEDGNVERALTIPEPQIFFVFGISIRLQQDISLADFKLILDSLYLEVTVNNRRELGPINLAHFPAGGGIYGDCGGAALNIQSNGMPSGQLMNWMPIPIVEKGGEVFQYRAYIGFTLAGMVTDERIECAQHGILFRRATSQ